MTIYHVSIGTRQYVIDVTGDRVCVNGELFDASLVSLNDVGLYLLRGKDLLGNPRAREVHLKALGKKVYQVLMNGRHVVAQVERGGQAGRKAAEKDSAGDVKAPMPGFIVQVCVEPGQVVEEGDTLVVMESMKMQMRLRAPIPGRVADLIAKPETQVEKGAVLVQIAPNL